MHNATAAALATIAGLTADWQAALQAFNADMCDATAEAVVVAYNAKLAAETAAKAAAIAAAESADRAHNAYGSLANYNYACEMWAAALDLAIAID